MSRKRRPRGYWSRPEIREVLLSTFSGERTPRQAARELRVSYDALRLQRSRFWKMLRLVSGRGWPEIMAFFGEPGMTADQVAAMVRADPRLSALAVSAKAAAERLLAAETEPRDVADGCAR